MNLLKSHSTKAFETKLYRSEKVTYEELNEKEGTNTKPKTEHHFTYTFTIFCSPILSITFICECEPKIERVNFLIKNIIKSIYKLTSINGYPNKETTREQYKQITKDSINYTSFKHSFYARYVGQRDRTLLIHL